MPRRENSAEMEKWRMHKGKRMISLGVLIFLVGLMRYYQWSWPVILMVAGVLIVLYGLSKKMMMK
jgi:hypothetical protein